MDVDAPRSLLRFFDDVQDPRMDRTQHHSLGDILFITICAVICIAAPSLSLKSGRQRPYDRS